LSKEDLVATATCFTAKSVADAYRRFIKPKVTLKRIVVGGGGALNPIILKHLQEYLSDVEVLTQEDLGYSSQAKEAIAFAVLGNQTIHGDYGNVPGATGASRSVILGNITPKPRKDYDEH
ncbi:MAG TPA: anhydro-N-acetylmuramic acid kinase, partial [Erysipelotrichaceae bacterium]|nr:anhydro-N-acetylmuramic acid kinase [Erysipelotrichaceae bacterium]